jgi:hypothetical protein
MELFGFPDGRKAIGNVEKPDKPKCVTLMSRNLAQDRTGGAEENRGRGEKLWSGFSRPSGRPVRGGLTWI